MDECTYGMHTCDDSTRADCINTNGSFTCACKEGYIGNGESCQLLGNHLFTMLFTMLPPMHVIVTVM